MKEILLNKELVVPYASEESLSREKPAKKVKERVIFVGSFLEESKNGGVGGQMFACKSLLASELSDHIEWLKIDSTAETNLERSLYRKSLSAFIRMMRFLFFLLTKRKIASVLIFTSNGLSFYEKGLMALIARRVFFKRVIISPRSGRLINDLKVKRSNNFIKRVFTTCEHIVCQGEYWKNVYSAEFPEIKEDKFTVIKNWMSFKNIDFSSLEHIKVVEGRILFLGWLEKEKGVFDLLDAAKMLREDNLDFEIIIAGEGKYKEELKGRIISENMGAYVKMPGWVKRREKIDLLKSTSIFVLPSYYEGMSNALMEAMAFRLPCVATNTGGIPDLITHEVNGLLTTPGDITGLYGHLKRLLLDAGLRKKIGFASREAIVKGHLVNSAIPKFKRLLLN